jgi:hypothetical protein
MSSSFDQRPDQHQFQDAGMGLGPPQVPQTLPGTMSQMVQSVSGSAGHALNGSNQQCESACTLACASQLPLMGV